MDAKIVTLRQLGSFHSVESLNFALSKRVEDLFRDKIVTPDVLKNIYPEYLDRIFSETGIAYIKEGSLGNNEEICLLMTSEKGIECIRKKVLTIEELASLPLPHLQFVLDVHNEICPPA